MKRNREKWDEPWAFCVLLTVPKMRKFFFRVEIKKNKNTIEELGLFRGAHEITMPFLFCVRRPIRAEWVCRAWIQKKKKEAGFKKGGLLSEILLLCQSARHQHVFA